MQPRIIIILIAALVVFFLTIGVLVYFLIFQNPIREEPPTPFYEVKTPEEISQSLTAPEAAGQAEIQKNVSKKLSPPQSGGEVSAMDILKSLAPVK